ncbi:MAG: SGNH/GDSL hydrolase family protein [Planctomycetota bacterium]
MKLKKKLLILLASTVITILLLELFSFIYYSAVFPKSIVIRDSELGWTFSGRRVQKRYGHILRFNSLGLRGGEIDLANDSYKIVLIGDSLTMGQEVSEEKTFSGIISEKLKSEKDNYEVINAGFGGYTLYQIKLAFKRIFANANNLYLVVYNFCANDMMSNEHAKNMTQETYRHNLHLSKKYRPMIFKAIFAFNENRRRKREAESIVKEKWFYNLIETMPPEEIWSDFMNNLIEMKNMVENKGGLFAISLLPPRGYFYFGEGDQNSIVFQMIEKFCRENDILVISTYRAVYRNGDESQFIDQAHFSEKGHSTIGNYLCDYIQRLKK